MAISAVAVLAIIAQSLTGAAYLADLFGERNAPRWLETGGLALAALLCGILAALTAVQHGPAELLRIGGIFAVLAALVPLAFLAVRRAFPVRTAGALVAPMGAALIALFLVEVGKHGHSSAELGVVLAVHITLAMLGLTAFAIAAALAVLYLVQERQIRRRTFGRLFQRLPSLDALDSSSFRLVAVGFFVYTISLVLGLVAELRGSDAGVDLRVALAVFAWLLFGIVIQTRITRGWRGRQAAIMTTAGFVSTISVLLVYALQSAP